jgi:regulator of replication initiation timing
MNPMPAASQENRGQFELSLFMDLTQFDELERRVVALIEVQEKLKTENRELQARVGDLESRIGTMAEDNRRLSTERDELLVNQRDPEKEALVRRKISDLLRKLENL